MRSSRALLVALFGGAALAGLFAAWLSTGWSDARARAKAIETAPVENATRTAISLARDFAAELESIRSGEDQRPYYEYQNLFHDPRGASTGLSVNPSPLASRNAHPLLSAHYQVDPNGQLTIPPLNEDLPQLNEPTALAGNRYVLEQLRSSKIALGEDLVKGATPLLASNTPARKRESPTPQQQAPTQAVELPQAAFTQNMNANDVFEQVNNSSPQLARLPEQAQQIAPRAAVPQAAIKPRPKPRRRAKPKEPDPREPIEIRIASFAWRTVEIAEEPRIVATRTVETPAGTIAQGFVVDPNAASEWLSSRTTDSVALIAADAAGEDKVSAPVPGITGWKLAVDIGPALATAGAEARRVRARFWWWFTPALIIGLAALGLVTWVVYRAERLARERSRFAAAAAHELRTPLAGLQLYGEMLADGLGDPSQSKSYAQRVSEEAARLGRVVGNVLGFTQLERGALAVDAQPGDVSEATRAIVERSRGALEAAGMTVTEDVGERVLARFDADAHARIIGNLLDNAEKYSRESGDRFVHVEVAKESDQIVISVTDGGSGVSEKERERIFKPFKRDVDADGAAGLGLGLTLARTLARDQGGDLACVDPKGKGARFELRLPSV